MDYKEKTLAELVDVLIRVDVPDFMRHKAIRMMGKILATMPSKEEIAKKLWLEYMEYCREAEKEEKIEHLGGDNFRITGTPVHFITWLEQKGEDNEI